MSVDAFIKKFSGLTEEYKFYDGQVTLRYEVEKHVYLLVTEDGGLEPQDGVTSICHIIDKSEPLMAWAVKLMANKMLTDGTMTLPSGERVVRKLSLQQYEELVLGAKKAHKDKLEDAGDVGHTAHDWIERYIKSVIAKDESLTQEILSKPPTDPRAANCCKAALEWMANHNVRWISTERKIYSRKYKFAGTLDGLCWVDSCDNPNCCKREFKDRLTISDWKTSNALYVEYLLQTAAYQRAFIEEQSVSDPHAPLVTDRWVIRLGKDDGEFDPWHADWDDFEQDWDAFEAALALKRRYEGVKGRVQLKLQETRESIKAAEKAAKEEALKLKCKGADKYKGVRAPRCNGGSPCLACRTKYAEVQAAKGKILKAPFDYSGPCDGEHAAPVCGDLHCWRGEYETRPERLLTNGGSE